MRPNLLLFVVAALVLPSGMFATGPGSPKCWRIMTVGDSITEGDKNYCVYRYPLWQKLKEAGYSFEFVGSKKTGSPVGPLAHEGYRGKNAEFLATVAPTNFRKNPADIVLIHAGHNHTAAENPVPGIISATEAMIAGFREVNPKVIIFVAQVIPSGKLPKYSYQPALNEALVKMAPRLNQPGSPVLVVNQAEGFDPKTDTIADKVHPNARGAEKMAARWFEALKPVLGPGPSQTPSPIPGGN